MTRNNIDKDTLFYADLETGEIIEVSMVKK